MARFITRSSIVAGGGGTDANPHGYSDASVTFRSQDFESNNASDIVETGADDLATWTWDATQGYGGTGAWKVELGVNSATGEGPESQQGKGLKWWDASGSTADQYPIVCVSWLMKISSQYLTVAYGNVPQLNKSKVVDIHGFNSAGTTSDINTRQLIQVNVVNPAEASTFGPSGVTCPAGVYLALTNGGAGGRWTIDGTNTPVDLRNYADTWLWVCGLFDCSSGGQRSILYYKASGESLKTSVIRTATDNCSSAGTYAFNNRGWAMPPTYNSFLWAYWQENRQIWSPKPSIIIDRVRCGNGWLRPPF